MEQGPGPAGCPPCCLQVHQVLHELRGGAGLSEDGKEEEVSTGVQPASGGGAWEGGRAGEARPRAECHGPWLIPSTPGSDNSSLVCSGREGGD